MAGFLEKLKFLGRSAEEDYIDIDIGQFEDTGGLHKMLLVADLDRLEVLPEIKQEIYSGNIVLVDVARIKRDKVALDKALGDLKRTVEEVSGDIAGIGDDLVAIVPNGIKIDREKVIGGKV